MEKDTAENDFSADVLRALLLHEFGSEKSSVQCRRFKSGFGAGGSGCSQAFL